MYDMGNTDSSLMNFDEVPSSNIPPGLHELVFLFLTGIKPQGLIGSVVFLFVLL